MLIVGGGPSGLGDGVGTGIAAGTCGELLQGVTSAGTHFHVTCPINKTSTVSVKIRRAKESSVVGTGDAAKLELALLATATYLDLEPCEIRIAHWSDLDISKGMGSSTADVVAAARAIAAAAGRKLNSSQLAMIATSIESSDGSMHPGIVAFGQKSGSILRRYDWWPRYMIVMVVPRNTLNTESPDFTGKSALGSRYDEMLIRLDEAVVARDTKSFAEVATESAQLNQQYVPNPHFALLADRISDFRALGLNVGHTGTVVGLLFDASDDESPRLAASAAVEMQSMFSSARVEIVLTPPWTAVE